MPAEFAAGLDTAMSSEARHRRGESAIAPVASLNAARRRRNRNLGWGAGLLTAAAAVAAVVAIVTASGEHGVDSTVAQFPASTRPSLS
jgi:hypothetical protein